MVGEDKEPEKQKVVTPSGRDLIVPARLPDPAEVQVAAASSYPPTRRSSRIIERGELYRRRVTALAPRPPLQKTSSPIAAKKRKRKLYRDHWDLVDSPRTTAPTPPSEHWAPTSPAVTPTFEWDHSAEEVGSTFSDGGDRDSVSTRAVSVDVSGLCSPILESGPRTGGLHTLRLSPSPSGRFFRFPSVSDRTLSELTFTQDVQNIVGAVLNPFSPFPVHRSVQRLLSEQVQRLRAGSIGSRAEVEEVDHNEPVFPPEETTDTMATDLRRRLQAKGKESCDAWDEEFSHYNYDLLSRADLANILQEAGGHKRALMENIRELDALASTEDTTSQELVKGQFIKFIREGLAHLAQLPPDQPQRPAPPGSPAARRRDPALTAAQKYKRKRVEKYEADMVMDLDNLQKEFEALLIHVPETERGIRTVEARHKALTQRSESLIKEGQSLCSDALEAELEEQAEALDEYIRKLRSTQREKETRIGELKLTAGVLGSSTSKHADYQPPVFSGEEGCDFFEFKTKYLEFADSRDYSLAEHLRTMKEVCLSGVAKAACQQMESVEEILKYLKGVYGQPRTLFDSKLKDFQKLGKCPGAPANKKRDWYIKTLNKLEYLQTLCAKHNLLNDLYYSPILSEIHQNIPWRAEQEFMARIVRIDDGDLSKEDVFNETILYIKELVNESTVSLRFSQLLGLKEAEKPPSQATKPFKKTYHVEEGTADFQGWASSSFQSSTGGPTAVYAVTSPSAPQEVVCKVCKEKHTHMFHCKKFQEAVVNDRFTITKACKVCMRCLRLDSELDLSDRRSWWNKHVDNCETKWACDLEFCGKNAKARQMHLTMCFRHQKENKSRGEEFVKSLDRSLVPATTRFFYSEVFCYPVLNVALPDPPVFSSSVEVLKDDPHPAIFMLQEIEIAEFKRPLLAFYDSGCSNSAISEDAYQLLDTQNIRSGPTEMGVAGGSTITIPGGVERFWLNTTTRNQKAEMQGLRMPMITASFPVYPLKKAFDSLQLAWENLQSAGLPPLPEVPDQVGGKAVDVMIGISYLRYFPDLVFSLPSGLSIYRAKFQAPGGNLGILGGPHEAWRACHNLAEVLTPAIFFSNEMLAYRIESNIIGAQNLDFTHQRLAEEDDDYNYFDLLHGYAEVQQAPDENEDAKRAMEELLGPFEQTDFIDVKKSPRVSAPVDGEDFFCTVQHCDKHQLSSGWTAPEYWNVTDHIFNIKTEADAYENLEDVGAEISYRCLRCRNCADCRRGDLFEKTSLMEELEQAMIEECVWVDKDAGTLMSKLPFTKDPITSLADNRQQAVKILDSQIRTISKNPQMKIDAMKAHDKLLSNGHVVAVNDLPADIKQLVVGSPRSYTIPWSCVAKEMSISTPFRLVFNASFKTRTGESLNSILPKGVNKLPKILHLLVRFASDKSAFCADVSMAYNSVKLMKEFYCFQKYLWKANLQPEDEVVDMVVATLIYGVKHAGNATTSGFEKTADYGLEVMPEAAEGAMVIKENMYMDDSMKALPTPEDCRRVAGQMVAILALCGIKIKDFTYSGTAPSDKVSADGKTAGVLGYLWWPVEDLMSVNVKDLYIGKVKKGRVPGPVEGSVKEALRPSFTKRTLTGKVAGVYDPRGLVTAITSRFKLNLAEIVDLKVDWDDLIPDRFLDVWVQNLADIQKIKTLRFPRSFVHPEAVSKEVRLIVSVDASRDIAVATVHAQGLLGDGSYSCCLVAAKSKLVHLATIPRAELRGAVLGATLAHIVRSNLGDQVTDIVYVTDSTIVLFWINQDSRPLQTAVRNAVIEVRRLSNIERWFHIDSANNVADIGTRFIEVENIDSDSPWVQGHPWMKLPREEMPIKSINDIVMDQQAVKAAQAEMRASDICGFTLPKIKDQVEERYLFSKYVVDPCLMSWEKSVRVLGFVQLFIARLKARVEAKKAGIIEPSSGVADLRPEWMGMEARFGMKEHIKNPDYKFRLPLALNRDIRDLQLSREQVNQAERYFFLKTTKETRQFTKSSEYKNCSKMIDGILTYTGRILDGQQIDDIENVMGDISPLSFANPVVDRYSPVAYSVAIYCHQKRVHHKNPVATLRDSRSLCYIVKGRDLMNEITAACTYCRRYKARLMDVEMGKVHPCRLTIAPAFFRCLVDMFGPYTAHCEHKHRSSIKVWGIVFKDPASGAIAVYAMPRSDTSAVLQAYNRHSFRYGHPEKIYIDGGTQLIKACEDMEVNWTDVATSLNSQYGTGVNFEVCPPHAHYMHGAVERSILEIKRIFNAVFSGLKMELFSFETAFAYCANEMNNLPLCLGSRYDNLGSTDIICPNRLLLGRNNRSAPVGFTGMAAPSELVDQMSKVHKGWWKAWLGETIADYIPKPTKWSNTSDQPAVGDVVIFVKESADDQPGDTIWRIGEVEKFEPSADGLVRKVWIKYKNNGRKKVEKVQRSVRDIAVLHRESELEIFEQLNLAAKDAAIGMLMRVRSGFYTTPLDWRTSITEGPLEFEVGSSECEDCVTKDITTTGAEVGSIVDCC